MADFERLQSPIEPTAVHDLVALCVENDRHREAQEVVKRAQQLGVQVSLRSHALMCSAIAKKGDVDRALAIAEELHRTHAVPPVFTVEFYDPLLSVFKAQSDWRATHRVIQQMHQLRLQPPLRAFRVLMLTCAKARQRDTLFATIAFVQKQFLTSGPSSSFKDVATLTAICQALVSVDETQRVLAIYNETDWQWLEAHGNTILFNNFLVAAVKQDKVMDRTLTIVDQMKRSRYGHPDDFTYATCMLEFEKRGDWDQVLALYNDMQEREVRTDASSSSFPAKPMVNALACAAVIRALHHMQAPRDNNNDDAEEGEGRSSQSLKLSPRLKRDLNVVLKKLAFIDLTHIGHASSLIDTLDEFHLYTPARQVFARMLKDGVIDTEAWMRKDGYEIDLHTFSYGVAKCAVVHAFEQIKRRHEHHVRTSNDQTQDLRIITGVGKHSREYLKPKIRDEVTHMFARSFRPPLWPATHPTNPGVLVIRSKMLRSWILKDGVVRYF